MRIDRQAAAALFAGLYPNFFAGEHVRNLPEDVCFDEMLLPLATFDPALTTKRWRTAFRSAITGATPTR